MKKYIFFLVFISLIVPSLLFSQGATCAEMEPFCTDSGASFPASIDTQAEAGNQYGCLGTQPNPAWYYLRIADPGYLEITLTNSNNLDVDFIVYGPYANLQAAQANCGSFQTQETNCPTGQICANGAPCDFFNGCVDGDGVDCSYDAQSTEIADIPNAQTGEVYVFLITNFSNQPTEVFVNKTGGEASTDCSIVECNTVSFLQDTPGGLDLLPATIDCTDDPLQLIAIPGNTPEINGFISPAFGIEIGTDASSPFQNSLEIYNGPNGTGDLLGYWGPGDMGGPYLGQVQASSNFTAFGEYIDPNTSYSFVWCDLAQTGFFQYEIIDYAIDDAPANVLGSGSLDNNTQNCFTVNFGAPSGTATFFGNAGITDTGTGRATFAPSALPPGTYTITYTWDDGDNCIGSETQTIEVTCDQACTYSGGQVVGPTTIELCAEDPPYILTTANEITDPAAGLPDVLWAVWVLDDPLNVTVSGGGSLPNDQFMFDDANYLGVLSSSPGQIIFGDDIEIIPDGSGITYYIAPFIGLGTFGTFDTDCTGLDPAQGYTVYMNPPLSPNVSTSGCDIQINLLGGFPQVDNTADYSWSYTIPTGQTVTGTGTPINVVGGTDGDYTFSITNDGNNCDLPNFATVTLNGCDCTANAPTTTMPCDDGNPCTINDEEIILDSNGTVCVPCSGTSLDCSSGQTMTQACDDGNPNTENDMETLLTCDASICIPCQGDEIMTTCEITTANVEITCNDSNTAESSDDTFIFTVFPVGNNTGITYSISGDVSLANIPYGVSSATFGPFPASTLVQITITDDSDPNCSISKTVISPCINVPTVSQWGLIILALILLNLGVLYIRQTEMKPVKQTA